MFQRELLGLLTRSATKVVALSVRTWTASGALFRAAAETLKVWGVFAVGVGAASGLAIGLDALGAGDTVQFVVPLAVLIAYFGFCVVGIGAILRALRARTEATFGDPEPEAVAMCQSRIADALLPVVVLIFAVFVFAGVFAGMGDTVWGISPLVALIPIILTAVLGVLFIIERWFGD